MDDGHKITGSAAGDSYFPGYHNTDRQQQTPGDKIFSDYREQGKSAIVAGRAKKRSRNLDNWNKEISTFSYVSSHDLQEPLRKIQTFSSRILEKEQRNLSDSGKEYLQRMQQAAHRMQRVIDDLITLSRVNSERQTKKIRLLQLIMQVLKEMPEAQQKNLSIDTTKLLADEMVPLQFQQLIHNLLRNSVKFSHAERQPVISISSRIVKGSKVKDKKLASQKKYCHITIEDNGIGFEQRFNERIFEVFQRLHAREDYDGTGIGLAICRKIVENYNGIILANGTLNQGAVFEIFLPIG
jgi:signal transduction histidine kinase